MKLRKRKRIKCFLLPKILKQRSNCFFFALIAWHRWYHKGAYLAIRKSKHIAGWHWLVNYKGRWIHYQPLNPRVRFLVAAKHKVYYKGKVSRKDLPIL